MGQYSLVEGSLLDAIDAAEKFLEASEQSNLSNDLQDDVSKVIDLLKAIDTKFLLGKYHPW